jgi:hypothetical protein
MLRWLAPFELGEFEAKRTASRKPSTCNRAGAKAHGLRREVLQVRLADGASTAQSAPRCRGCGSFEGWLLSAVCVEGVGPTWRFVGAGTIEGGALFAHGEAALVKEVKKVLEAIHA